jgi:hypothetical protein
MSAFVTFLPAPPPMAAVVAPLVAPLVAPAPPVGATGKALIPMAQGGPIGSNRGRRAGAAAAR